MTPARWAEYPNFIRSEFNCLLPVSGYEDKYFVSSSGRVFSAATGSLVERKLIKDARGYLVVALWKNGLEKQIKVHRLVASAFLPNPSGKRTVNHKNGDKTDNRLCNLEWATHGENKSHSFRVLGERHWMSGKTGADCLHSKQVEQIDLQTNQVLAVYSGTQEARRLTGFSQGNISAVCRGLRRSANGYFWRYRDDASKMV